MLQQPEVAGVRRNAAKENKHEYRNPSQHRNGLYVKTFAHQKADGEEFQAASHEHERRALQNGKAGFMGVGLGKERAANPANHIEHKAEHAKGRTHAHRALPEAQKGHANRTEYETGGLLLGGPSFF